MLGEYTRLPACRELDEVRRLLAALSVDNGGPVDAELIGNAITRVRLMQIAIERSDTNVAANTMTAARTSVTAAIDVAC